jgi:2'-5' RNA ligase
VVEEVGRLFVAVPLTDDVRAALAAHLMESTGGRPLPGKPVPPANWHITLRFLGKTDSVAYDRLVAGLANAGLGKASPLSFGNLGAFPRPARATVLWLGVERGSERLGDLAAAAEDAAQQAGFGPEDRPFHSHLTLSRIRPHQDVRPLIEGVAPFPMSMPIERVVVYRSHLGRGGARYEELESFTLDDR